MKDSIQLAEQAEFWQSVKALMIPLSLFLACVISAAGVFLVYNGESLGWLFICLAGATIVAAIVGLVRFQNKYRAKGIMAESERAHGFEQSER